MQRFCAVKEAKTLLAQSVKENNDSSGLTSS